jgi:hypothetical protein
MGGSFRDTPKIIFRMGRMETIDKFIACSFDTFHCAPFLNCSGSKANDAPDSRVACGRVLRRCGSFAARTIPKTPCQN